MKTTNNYNELEVYLYDTKVGTLESDTLNAAKSCDIFNINLEK